ncbi:hypothetical protein CLSAB_19690 [Clostridium saccharobutylicum]|uniref:hypothetical protein n=1 Tax=Clostridium saccharobutylicum TaxID=169679 RepID=UPI00098C0903|nr:hypothetical protein [Clostridium saccharobutylicum]OOM17249.1 hypothetical protein CLSAB_19690 [Clostridium saccharobutylicum]
MKDKICKLLESDRNKLIAKISILAIIALGTFIYVNVASKKEAIQTNKTTAKTDTNKTSKSAYVPTDEEKKVLSKHYNQLSGSELETLANLKKKSDLFIESDRANIKDNLERLAKEKDSQVEKSVQQSKDNKQIYDSFKTEIESEFQNIKYDMITGTDNNKNLMLYVALLDNLESTKSKCKELVLNKETKMKDLGIKKIVFTAKNSKGEIQGTYMFELKNGVYQLSLDAF